MARAFGCQVLLKGLAKDALYDLTHFARNDREPANTEREIRFRLLVQIRPQGLRGTMSNHGSSFISSKHKP